MKYKHLLVQNNLPLREALKLIDAGGERILFVVTKDSKLLGSLTDGDIRRWILSTGNLEGSVKDVCNTAPVTIQASSSRQEIKKLVIEKQLVAVPVLDANTKVVDIVFWESLFGDKPKVKPRQIDAPVVIMAGGLGSRLEPFTRILPKPLIPINDRAMIEIIMDEYAKYGMTHFHVSVHHKARMLKAYFEEFSHGYNIEYIEEEKPLGTAGALALIKGHFSRPFFVSNCDIIIDEDYSRIYDFHSDGNYALTLVASMKHVVIPYGVCELERDGGSLKRIVEKPEYNYLVNTGMYVVDPDALKYIDHDKALPMTTFVEALQKAGKSIGVFPVSQDSWIDVGQWEEYKNAIAKLQT